METASYSVLITFLMGFGFAHVLHSSGKHGLKAGLALSLCFIVGLIAGSIVGAYLHEAAFAGIYIEMFGTGLTVFIVDLLMQYAYVAIAEMLEKREWDKPLVNVSRSDLQEYEEYPSAGSGKTFSINKSHLEQ